MHSLAFIITLSLCIEQSGTGSVPSESTLTRIQIGFSVINGLLVLGASFQCIAAFCLDHVSILLCLVSPVAQFLRKGQQIYHCVLNHYSPNLDASAEIYTEANL